MVFINIIKKFGKILSQRQKLRIFELFLLMIFGGILETLSVSLILPFTNAIMDWEGTCKKSYVIYICDILGINSSKDFFVLMSIFMAFLYVLKNLFLLFEYNIQYRFIYNNMIALQKQLLKAFIGRPYEFFIKMSSGEIIRIVTNDTTEAFNLLITLLAAFTEIVVSIMLVVTTFIIAPFITSIIASVLILVLVFIYAVIRPILKKAGENQQNASMGMNRWLLQSIHGIKELKVMQKEIFFQDNYDKYGQMYVRSLRQRQILGTAPRFIIEGVCMGAMFFVVVIMIFFGIEIESLVPMLAVVAMAAVRLLPSANRISGALSSIAYCEPMLDKVIENLQLLHKDYNREDGYANNPSDISMTGIEREITLESISYNYPESEQPVLKDANMKINIGESVGIVGVSGAGKTTTVDIILGLLKPKSGNVCIDGVDIHNDMQGWLSQIGYIPQMIFMLDDTIRANVAFGEDEASISDEKVWDSLKEAQLDTFVKALPDGLDTQIGERGVRLSGGQRQRIGIARALYNNPNVLIFDEATSALDNDTESEIMKAIYRLHGRKTLIIIAHRLSTIEACDHVFRVEDGKITKER